MATTTAATSVATPLAAKPAMRHHNPASLTDRRYLAKSITQLGSSSILKLLRLLDTLHPAALVRGTPNSPYNYQFDVDKFEDAAFRDVEDLVRRELNDDDVFGRNELEREAAASIAAILPHNNNKAAQPSPPLSNSSSDDDNDDDDNNNGNNGDEGEAGKHPASRKPAPASRKKMASSSLEPPGDKHAKPKKQRKGGPLIFRDELKDKHFEFDGVPCKLLSMQVDTKRPWVCTFPGCATAKGFVSKDKAIRHSLIHSGIKPFECPLCQRPFNDKANMNIHLKNMHAACPTCLARFEKDSVALKEHIAAEHKRA
jgi:hypothetical protein